MAERLAGRDTIARAPGVLTRRVLDGIVLLAPDADESLRVTTPGDALWAMLDEPCDFADLVGAWSELFDLASDTAHADVVAVLAVWLDAGAIVVTRAP